MIDKIKEHIAEVEKFTTKAKEDIFMLSYFAWILSKTTHKPLYQTTLNVL